MVRKEKAPPQKPAATNLEAFFFKPQHREDPNKGGKQVQQHIHNIFGKKSASPTPSAPKPVHKPGTIADSSEDEFPLDI